MRLKVCSLPSLAAVIVQHSKVKDKQVFICPLICGRCIAKNAIRYSHKIPLILLHSIRGTF